MSLITCNENDFIAVIKLNRPESMNALNWDLVDELTQKIKALSQEAAVSKIRALVIGSTDSKAFCVGADLKERVLMTEDKVVQTLDKLRALMDAISDFPAPTIAAIEGLAFGGGFELALACDLRVSHLAATLGLTETTLAIIPGAGGTQRLSRIVGEAKAKRMIFLSEKIKGEVAFAQGIVDGVSADPWRMALAWAKDFSKKGPLAMRLAKESIKSGFSLPIKEALDVERACYLRLLSSKDRTEGLKAFTERREGVYTGE